MSVIYNHIEALQLSTSYNNNPNLPRLFITLSTALTVITFCYGSWFRHQRAQHSVNIINTLHSLAIHLNHQIPNPHPSLVSRTLFIQSSQLKRIIFEIKSSFESSVGQKPAEADYADVSTTYSASCQQLRHHPADRVTRAPQTRYLEHLI